MIEHFVAPVLPVKALLTTMPSVMPATVGTIGEPATELAICEIVTKQRFCKARINVDAATTLKPGTIIYTRL